MNIDIVHTSIILPTAGLIQPFFITVFIIFIIVIKNTFITNLVYYMFSNTFTIFFILFWTFKIIYSKCCVYSVCFHCQNIIDKSFFVQSFSIRDKIGNVQNQLIDTNQNFKSHRSGKIAPTTYPIKKDKNKLSTKDFRLKCSHLFT